MRHKNENTETPIKPIFRESEDIFPIRQISLDRRHSRSKGDDVT